MKNCSIEGLSKRDVNKSKESPDGFRCSIEITLDLGDELIQLLTHSPLKREISFLGIYIWDLSSILYHIFCIGFSPHMSVTHIPTSKTRLGE